MPVLERVRKMWNAFTHDEQVNAHYVVEHGPSYGSRPDRNVVRYTNERSIISSIYTRLAIDVSQLSIRHVKLDKQGRYSEDMDSRLNRCFTLEANLDQAPTAFRLDIMMSLFSEGSIAIVPVDTVQSPASDASFDIQTMRVGNITRWFPEHVTVSLYNIALGKRQEITLEKRYVAIVENPLYSVMNEPNSTLQRLVRKLNLLDGVDEALGSGKLDLIIQLPYVIKSEARRQQAEKRREDIEFQLKGSKYGIAYTDGTEKITQLNRPAENNLLKQIEYLTNMLYGQLGLTEEIMNGTADEKAMLAYFNRTIEPLITAVIEAMRRAFLGRRGLAAMEDIRYFQNPFKLVPVNDLAEIADKFTRNEILTANELRGFMGLPPHEDPKADKLINSNMPQVEETTESPTSERNGQNGS